MGLFRTISKNMLKSPLKNIFRYVFRLLIKPSRRDWTQLNGDHTLKICIVAFKFPILGRASDHGFLWPIAKGLAQKNHKVTVIAGKSPLGRAEVIRDGVRVFYLHEGYPNLAHLPFEEAVLEKFSQLHKEEKFDLVHSIDRSASLLAQLKYEFDVKVAYDVDATQMSQIFSILGMAQENISSVLSTMVAVAYKFLSTFWGGDRQLLAEADGVFVTSPVQRIFLERYYLYPDYHTYTVPYGIELGDLTTKVFSQELHKKWKVPEHGRIVMTITDMTVPEEVIDLLKAFEKVAIKKPFAYMIIVGNGPYFKQIEFEVFNLAIGSRVILTGALKPEDIAECISIAEVFINLSSRTTGFEPDMIEAMAQKKIIIGSELSPISHIISDGKDGFLLRPADKLSLSTLLVELLSGGLPTEEIGAKARDKVLNLFDTQHMLMSLLESYKKILTRSI